MKTTDELGPLPLEHIREYDSAADYYARNGRLPMLMGSPGAVDWILADNESFMERVREFKYANAMNKTTI